MTLKTFLYWSILVQDRLLYKSFVLSATAFELCSIAEPDTTDTKSRSHKLPFLSKRLFRFLQPHAWICSFAIYSNYSMLCNAVLIDRLPRSGRFRFQPYCCLRQIVKLRKLFFCEPDHSARTQEIDENRGRRRERERGRERVSCAGKRPWHIFAAEVNDQRSWLGKLVTVVGPALLARWVTWRKSGEMLGGSERVKQSASWWLLAMNLNSMGSLVERIETDILIKVLSVEKRQTHSSVNYFLRLHKCFLNILRFEDT